MNKYVVKTTLLGTDTGSQSLSVPVEASTPEGAVKVIRVKLDKIVSEGKASGYTTPTAREIKK